MRQFAIFWLLLLCGPAAAGPDLAPVSEGRLDQIPLHAPEGAPDAVVVYFSDRSGWAPSDDTNVAALVDANNAVLGVDLAKYGKALDADTGECLYMVGELTDLVQKTERQLGLQTYLPAIIAGAGEGATLAYATVADAPPNTLGGGVALGFTGRLGLRLPICPGASSAPAPGGGLAYAFDRKLPEKVTLLVPQDLVDQVSAQAAGVDALDVQPLQTGDEPAQLAAAVSDIAQTIDPFDGLPVIDLPSKTGASAVALFVSGDGGWRDLDKTIGEWMASDGIHVAGVDALHYFWSEKTPQDFAADIGRILAQTDPDGTLPVMLLGYSFGADTMPLAWPHLPPELQRRVRMIGLLGPSHETGMQISVSNWLGLSGGTYEVVPAIAAMPRQKVVCVYGVEEDDTACSETELDGVSRIEIDGGHHFDGDYVGLGKRLLAEFAKRR